MIPRNRLLRMVALPALEDMSAQAVCVRKYGERWYVRVLPVSEQRLAQITREWPDVEVHTDEHGVALMVFVDPEQRLLVGMGGQCRHKQLRRDSSSVL